MKALTLHQPWATLVAIGAKKIETRSWPTSYRGPLAIHAGSHWSRENKELCLETPFRSALKAAGYRSVADLPTGAIIAVATLELVGKIGYDEDGEIVVDGLDRILSNEEVIFGNYAPGRFGWVLGDVCRVRNVILIPGQQGLWDVPASICNILRREGCLS